MSIELTVIESNELKDLESVIDNGMRTFIDVGSALLKIRDGRLYRATHKTFEEYCVDRWEMSKGHAYRLIASSEVVSNLSPIGDIIPQTESQARPLTRLEPEQQRKVWRRAIETAPPGKMTAQHIKGVVVQIDSIRLPEEGPRKPHVAHNSGENEWYTPPIFIEAARRAMGSIDLDPASSKIANRIVGAKQFFTKDDSGLDKQWTGRVFMNPPYVCNLIKKFTNKFIRHWESGEIESGIVLVNNATETQWFQALAQKASAVCFPAGRIKFRKPGTEEENSPLQGQAFIYFGNEPDKFLDEFKNLDVPDCYQLARRKY